MSLHDNRQYTRGEQEVWLEIDQLGYRQAKIGSVNMSLCEICPYTAISIKVVTDNCTTWARNGWWEHQFHSFKQVYHIGIFVGIQI